MCRLFNLEFDHHFDGQNHAMKFFEVKSLIFNQLSSIKKSFLNHLLTSKHSKIT